MFKLKKDEDDFITYYNSKVLSSGQVIKIEFQEDWTNSKYYYNIYLVISDKRKTENNTYLKSTGKDGLQGLLWAKENIRQFEDFIKEQHKDIPIIIHCGWDNNRRRNVYERGLKDLGYKFDMVFGSKALCKKINN